ncbi:MAG: hypothetical protein BroJett011_63330 [Chloroflexota bacterium]|nr:MAG: hypothetical protein BroJett011_63330 [Chloroflexota bacterium]
MFGRNSTPATYPIISIVLFLGVAPWIIITQNKLYEEEVPIPIEVNKTRYYRLENIRVLLNEGFTSEELRRLCHDVPNFREVYDKLAQSTGKAEIIDYLIEYANRKLQFEALLDWAKEHNPIRYEKHQPYYEVNQEHD